MSKYLVVAEVDKIQSFVFGSSRLREIAGASQLLEEFCKDVKNWYRAKHILSSKGGSFRIIADDKNDAEKISTRLQQEFTQQIGGSMTTTWVEYKPENTAISRGNRALRRAKLNGTSPSVLWHSPFHAICESSGTELAVTYARPGGKNEKGDERFPNEPRRYLGKRTLAKSNENATRNLLYDFIRTDEEIKLFKNPTEANTYAQFDDRQYVAYMVADGNAMGSIFNQTKPQELFDFSESIGDKTIEAVRASVLRDGIMAESYEDGHLVFPALPLISGGDDLFMLMPATWAVNIALTYCDAYQGDPKKKYSNSMTERIRKLSAIEDDFVATTGAAVVICKASYPYQSAHAYAEELLQKAKNKAKELNQSCLIVDFVVGSDTVTGFHHIDSNAYTTEDAQDFLDYRYDLRELPSRILQRLEKALTDGDDTQVIIKRVNDLYPKLDYADILEKALEKPAQLRELLKLWDFSYNTSKLRNRYQVRS